MAKELNCKLVLEDGEEYVGCAFGAKTERVAEVVFNTSMVGYQEIVTDPASTDKAVVMTYPLIGNYGTADDDNETRVPTLGIMIVSEYNDLPSNFRSIQPLGEMLEDAGIPGIEGIDTRRLTRSIRDKGSRRCIITDISTSTEEAVARIAATPIPHDAISRVSCRRRWYSRTANPRYHVVCVDCGIKQSVIRTLNKNACNVTVVPYGTTAEEILSMRPDGVLLSDGPGAPEDAASVSELVRALRTRVPILAIGLGHLVTALAYGATVTKMSYGAGTAHPVVRLSDGHVEMTSQSRGYTVDEPSLAGTGLSVTHRDLHAKTVEGLRSEDGRVITVSFHPESAPGPEDTAYIFDCFMTMMEEDKHNA